MSHTVAAIHFARRRPSSMTCSCSWSGQWDNDVELEEAWKLHRSGGGKALNYPIRPKSHHRIVGKAPIDARSMHDR